MTASQDVDEIATTVRDDPSGPNLARLWRAVYALERWWLLPTGSAADPRPMIGVVAEQRFLLAFTAERHVTTFTGTHTGDPAPAALMSVTPAELTGLAPGLAREGISGVLFDQGVHDIVAPIAGLPSMWSRFGS